MTCGRRHRVCHHHATVDEAGSIPVGRSLPGWRNGIRAALRTPWGTTPCRFESCSWHSLAALGSVLQRQASGSPKPADAGSSPARPARSFEVGPVDQPGVIVCPSSRRAGVQIPSGPPARVTRVASSAALARRTGHPGAGWKVNHSGSVSVPRKHCVPDEGMGFDCSAFLQWRTRWALDALLACYASARQRARFDPGVLRPCW